jgi:hypothetical protein
MGRHAGQEGSVSHIASSVTCISRFTKTLHSLAPGLVKQDAQTSDDLVALPGNSFKSVPQSWDRAEATGGAL